MACGNHSGSRLGAIWGRLWAGLGFSRICCGPVLRPLGRAVLGSSRTFLWPREEGFRSFGSISHLSESDRCEIDPKLLHGVPRTPSALAVTLARLQRGRSALSFVWVPRSSLCSEGPQSARFGERLRSVAEHINASTLTRSMMWHPYVKASHNASRSL